MKLRYIVIATLILAARVASGTDQVPDYLTYEGKKLFMRGITLVARDAGNEADKILREGMLSTAQYRGYVAHWSIRDGKLYIDRVSQEYYPNPDRPEDGTKERTIPLEILRKGKKAPCVVDWYTGIVCGKSGDVVQWDVDNGPVMSHEYIFHVVKGKIERTGEIKLKEYNPYRTHRDLMWCALGDPKTDQKEKEWIDARLFRTSAGDPFIGKEKRVKTRGQVFLGEHKAIDIWSTPKARGATILLEDVPVKTDVSTLDHAEVEGTLRRDGDELIMKVTSIRTLRFGESIHSSAFAENLKRFEADQIDEK